MKGPAAALALVIGALGLVVGRPAAALIPSATKVSRAVAAANTEGRRSQPLALQVALLDGSGTLVASGTLRLDPRGGERLELQGADGMAEVHERSAAGYRATRGSQPLAQPMRLLLPGQVLQARDAGSLQLALQRLGVDGGRVDLGIEGDHDCWVLGGRDPGAFDANRRPSLWVDLDSHEPVRIDEGGVHYRLGPMVASGGIRFPAWIEIEVADAPPQRMEIRAVSPTR
jgi:hypothetical protein